MKTTRSRKIYPYFIKHEGKGDDKQRDADGLGVNEIIPLVTLNLQDHFDRFRIFPVYLIESFCDIFQRHYVCDQ
jgi:hypothetical protein